MIQEIRLPTQLANAAMSYAKGAFEMLFIIYLKKEEIFSELNIAFYIICVFIH